MLGMRRKRCHHVREATERFVDALGLAQSLRISCRATRRETLRASQVDEVQRCIACLAAGLRATHTQRKHAVTPARALVHFGRCNLPALLSTCQELIHIVRSCEGHDLGGLYVRVVAHMDNVAPRMVAEQIGNLVQIHLDHLRLKRVRPAVHLLCLCSGPQHVHGTGNQTHIVAFPGARYGPVDVRAALECVCLAGACLPIGEDSGLRQCMGRTW